MTGIIICDDCRTPFFAHGLEENLPSYMQDIPLFIGVRKITSTVVNSGLKRHVVSKFVDLCDACNTKRLRK